MVKKAAKKLDLSAAGGESARLEEFEVKDYDYDKSERSAQELEFENDLQFLLTPQQAPTTSKSRKKKLNKAAKSVANNEVHIKKKKVEVKTAEITEDIDDIPLSSDDESVSIKSDAPRTQKRDAPLESKHAVKSDDSNDSIEKDDQKEKDNTPSNIDEEQAISKKSLRSKMRRKQKRERRREQAKKKENDSESLKDGSEADTSAAENSTRSNSQEPEKEKSTGPEKEKNNGTEKEKSNGTGKEKSNGNDSTKKQDQLPKMNRPSPSIMASLPEIEPVSTIIGLSHQQILTMRTNDVKFKTLVSVPKISKMCRNVLDFTMKETDGFFRKDAKKKQFIQLCVMVALKESKGFHDVSRKFPHLLETLAEYRELTLEHTKTSLTESSRQAHQNNFDYSVMSYIGHILIWLAYCQRKLKKPQDVLGMCDLTLSNKDILTSLGGFHLWDRIRRDVKTINNKRWKHILKFRNNFLFEEHQFIVIVRFMNLDVDLNP